MPYLPAFSTAARRPAPQTEPVPPPAVEPGMYEAPYQAPGQFADQAPVPAPQTARAISPPRDDAYRASDINPTLPSASGYYGGLVDPAAPQLHPGQWHSSLLYPARGVALPRPPEETAPVLGPDLQSAAAGGLDALVRAINAGSTARSPAPAYAPGITPSPAGRDTTPGQTSVPLTPAGAAPAAAPAAVPALAPSPVISGTPATSGGGPDAARSGGASWDLGGADEDVGFTRDDDQRAFTADDFMGAAGWNRARAPVLAMQANAKRRKGKTRTSTSGAGFPFTRPNTPMRDYILAAIAESLARRPGQ